MGAFNILNATACCPSCLRQGVFEVQFKYGNTWQQEYALGEQLAWGGNDIGVPGCRRLRIEAIGGPCRHCGRDDLEFDILAEEDRLVALLPVGTIREHESREGYVIEEGASPGGA